MTLKKEEFDKRLDLIEKELLILNEKLKSQKLKMNEEPRNWGLTGKINVGVKNVNKSKNKQTSK